MHRAMAMVLAVAPLVACGDGSRARAAASAGAAGASAASAASATVPPAGAAETSENRTTKPRVAAVPSSPAAAPSPPPGWTSWGLAPPGCTLWIPESRAALERLPDLAWRACPFQPVGCTALGAPWAARTGWGFGGRLGAVAAGERTYLTFARQLEPELWETVVLAGASSRHPALRPVAAWRQRLPEAGCVLGAVSLTADRGRVTAALPVIRAEAENAPWIYLGAPESLSQPPEATLASLSELTSLDGLGAPLDGLAAPRDGTRRVESFGGPGAEAMASGVALRRGDLLAVWEHEGRFALRDLTTGQTFRPTPPEAAANPSAAPAFRALLEPTPLGGAVVFGAWLGERNSVWMADRRGRPSPLLADPRASFDRFTSDGQRAVWLRSTGFRDLNTFERVELWTATLAAPPAGAPGAAGSPGRPLALVAPRRLRSLPAGPLPLVSIGDGWAALWRAEDDVLLVRLSDGELRRLPAVPQLAWDGGSGGLAIAAGAVWARASLRGQAGNDTRLIARFVLEALPKGALP